MWLHVAGDSTARGLYGGLKNVLSIDACRRRNLNLTDDVTGRRAIGNLEDCNSTTVSGLRATFMSRDMLWRMPRANVMANLTVEHHLNNDYLRSWAGRAQRRPGCTLP